MACAQHDIFGRCIECYEGFNLHSGTCINVTGACDNTSIISGDSFLPVKCSKCMTGYILEN